LLPRNLPQGKSRSYQELNAAANQRLTYNKKAFLRRDGGTGRRSGLKIRRPSGLGGSTPPPGTISKTHRIRGYLDSLSARDEPVQQTQRTLRQYITNERLVHPTENSKFTYKML
jgi:hypothetical protein